MLYYETIDATTLELLIKLQALPILRKMRLVGGTSLALQIGHRKSIDIDLYFILKKYTLSELMLFYDSKYLDGSRFLVLKSLVYFDDAETEVMPFMFDNISWKNVKDQISKVHADYVLHNKN